MLQLIAYIAVVGMQGAAPEFDAAAMRAAELLVRSDIETLIADVKGSDEVRRQHAVWAIGLARDSQHALLLLEATRDEGVREEALRSLYFLGMPAYRVVLNEALSGDPIHRWHAAQVLRDLVTNHLHRPVPKEARKLIWELRVSNDARIREIALRYGRAVGGGLEVVDVEPFLNDPGPINRQLAIGVIAGKKKDVVTTERMLNIAAYDSHAGVRAYALSNFGYMGLQYEETLGITIKAIGLGLESESVVANEALDLINLATGPDAARNSRTYNGLRPGQREPVSLQRGLAYSYRNSLWQLTKSRDRETRWKAMVAAASMRIKPAKRLLETWQPRDKWEAERITELIEWLDSG